LRRRAPRPDPGDAKGNLHATAETGGAHGAGVVFERKRKADGFQPRLLHSFCFRRGDESDQMLC